MKNEEDTNLCFVTIVRGDYTYISHDCFLERESGNINFKGAVVCVDDRQFENHTLSYLDRKVTYF